MTTENKMIVATFINRVWNSADYDAISDFIAEQYVAHLLGSQGTLSGLDGVQRNVRSAHQSRQGLQITIEDQIAEGNKVMSRVTMRSVRDGREATMREIIIHEIAQGKIV